MCVDSLSCCLFFFQAEDGIRDLTVTGVQTCALPILSREFVQASAAQLQELCEEKLEGLDLVAILIDGIHLGKQVLVVARSEERRVGKECRSRWSPYH